MPLARDLFDAEFIEEVHEGARPGGGAERTVGYSFPEYDHDVRTAVVRGLNKQSTVAIIDPFVFQSPERYAGPTAGPVFGCARNFGEILQAFATGGGILAESLVPLA